MAIDVDFIDGFSHYPSADIEKKWTTKNSTVTIESGAGPRGGDCLRGVTATAYVRKTIPASATHVMGVRIKPTTTPGQAIFALLDVASFQCFLYLNADGTFSVLNAAGSPLTGGTGGLAPDGQWTHVEWKVTVANSIGAGTCQVQVNGALVITVTTGQDTQGTANATANNFQLGNHFGGGGHTIDFADFYHGTGTDFAGDCRVDQIVPTAEGAHSDFTPSTGTDNSALVDETAPNTADYVSSGTVGAIDTYVCSNLTGAGAIKAVAVNCYAKKSDAGSRTLSGIARSDGTDGEATAQALATGDLIHQFLFPLDPDGSVAWTEASVNAAEFGQKVAA